MQAWSLGLELLFYLVAPFIVRRSAWSKGLIAAACLAARTVGYVAGLQDDPWSCRFFPWELSAFLAGALSYRIGQRFKGSPLCGIAKVSALGIIPAIILFPLYDTGAQIFFTAWRIGLYAYLAAALPVLYRLTKDAHWDRIAGDLSYPVYLCHMISVQLIYATGVLASHAVAGAALVAAANVALAGVATRFVEIPIDKFRQSRMHRAAAPGRMDGRAPKVTLGGALVL
jgi:peptidoglycan/LPS O-acetylase OafA/YrhL